MTVLGLHVTILMAVILYHKNASQVISNIIIVQHKFLVICSVEAIQDLWPEACILGTDR